MTYVGQGLVNTLLITLIAAVLGLVLGFIVAVVKIAAEHNKWMKIPAAICNVYTTIFRGTPVALQLFIMVFAIFAIPGFKPYAAILTFGINSGAYVSESIRAGILSVDKGQMEAGRALGFSWLQTMVKIILPQAVKTMSQVCPSWRPSATLTTCFSASSAKVYCLTFMLQPTRTASALCGSSFFLSNSLHFVRFGV